MRKLARVAAVVAGIVAASACQMDVKLSTTVNRDGSGTFVLRFAADKELVDLAKGLPEDPFASLGEIPADLQAKGWRATRSNQGGGVQILVERPFTSPDDLNRALTEVQTRLSAQEGPKPRFYSLTLKRSTSFLRTKTTLDGTIDLSIDGLLAGSSLSEEERQTLRTQVGSIAGQFFRFTLEAKLPGSVSGTRGDPEKVEGGRVTWSQPLGRVLTFGATTSTYSSSALATIGGAGLVLLILVAAFVLRRRAVSARKRSPSPEEGVAPGARSRP